MKTKASLALALGVALLAFSAEVQRSSYTVRMNSKKTAVARMSPSTVSTLSHLATESSSDGSGRPEATPFLGGIKPLSRKPWQFKGINFVPDTYPTVTNASLPYNMWYNWMASDYGTDAVDLYGKSFDSQAIQVECSIDKTFGYARDLGCEVVEVYLDIYLYCNTKITSASTGSSYVYYYYDSTKTNSAYLAKISRFLDLADSYGLKVLFTFFPFYYTISPSDGFTDYNWQKKYLQDIVGYVKGHPALYAWGICSEFDLFFLGYHKREEIWHDGKYGHDDPAHTEAVCQKEIVAFVSEMLDTVRGLDDKTYVELEDKDPESLGWFATYGYSDALTKLSWIGLSLWEQPYAEVDSAKSSGDWSPITNAVLGVIDEVPSYTTLPVVISEFGMETHSYTEDQQRSFYQAVLKAATERNVGVRPWLLNDFSSWKVVTSYDKSCYSGLIDPATGDTKEAWDDFKAWTLPGILP